MSRAWERALEEHRVVVRAYLEQIAKVEDEAWGTPRAPGKWSPAEEVLHVAMAYELGGPKGAADGMRLVASPLKAWAARTFYLPVMLRTRTFPRNVAAPREVRPDAALAVAVRRTELVARLKDAADRAAQALQAAADRTPEMRISHAYFGPLSPLTALRLLTAHTRHHTVLSGS